MMRKLFILVFWGIVVAFGVSWLSRQTGRASIEWQGWQIDLSTSLLVSLLVVIIICLFLLERVIRGFIEWPGWISANWQARRKQGGERALGLGMVAFSAGDFKVARRQARKAEKLLGAGVLPDLLSAQAAHASGDSRAATRYFTALSKEDDTAYFGYIGLMRLNHENGRIDESVKHARAALSLQADSVPAAAVLLVQDLTRQNWVGAYEKAALLAKHEEDGLGPRDSELLAAHVCLMIADQKNGGPARREWLIRASAHVDRLTAPALRCAEDEQASGKKRQAIKTLETAFKVLPHTDYLAALSEMTDDNDGQFVSRIGSLAKSSHRPDEGYLMMAWAALDRSIWASASAALERVSLAGQTNQFFLLKARLSEMGGLETSEIFGNSEESLKKAAVSPRGAGWFCAHCKVCCDEWAFICTSCNVFGQISWGVLDRNVRNFRLGEN